MTQNDIRKLDLWSTWYWILGIFDTGSLLQLQSEILIFFKSSFLGRQKSSWNNPLSNCKRKDTKIKIKETPNPVSSIILILSYYVLLFPLREMTSDLHGNGIFFLLIWKQELFFLLLLQPLKQNKKSSLRKPVEISGAIAHLQNFLPLPR